MTAVRNSLLLSLRQRVNDLPGLIDALDLETDPGVAAAEAERLTAENERLKAWLCLCPDGMPADFNPDEQCPIHGDPAKARSARALRDELAKYVGWEPTAKEEYEHACGQLAKVADLVHAFRDDHLGHLDRPGAEEAVIAFLGDLKNALEM